MSNINIRQTQNHNTQYYGIHVPKGAVCAVFPECVIRGKHRPKMYAWVVDLKMARQQRHFYVYTLTINDRFPRKTYVDGSHGYAHALQEFIKSLPETSLNVHVGATLRQIGCLDRPRDREVGKYTMRPHLGHATNPYIMTDYDCKEMKVYNEKV